MIRGVRTREIAGTAVTWTGQNPDEVREVAGDRLLRVWGRHAVVLANDGVSHVHMCPGWMVIRSGEVLYFNTEDFAADGSHPLWEATG